MYVPHRRGRRPRRPHFPGFVTAHLGRHRRPVPPCASVTVGDGASTSPFPVYLPGPFRASGVPPAVPIFMYLTVQFGTSKRRPLRSLFYPGASMVPLEVSWVPFGASRAPPPTVPISPCTIASQSLLLRGRLGAAALVERFGVAGQTGRSLGADLVPAHRSGRKRAGPNFCSDPLGGYAMEPMSAIFEN